MIALEFRPAVAINAIYYKKNYYIKWRYYAITRQHTNHFAFSTFFYFIFLRSIKELQNKLNLSTVLWGAAKKKLPGQQLYMCANEWKIFLSYILCGENEKDEMC